MSAAAILLSDSSRSITSVAEALGYSSMEHFPPHLRLLPAQSKAVPEGRGLSQLSGAVAAIKFYHSFPESSGSGSRKRSRISSSVTPVSRLPIVSFQRQ